MNEKVRFTAVTPYLFYPDGDAAAQWLTDVLGFGPARKVPDEEGRWMEGEIAVGAHQIALNGGYEGDDKPSGGLLIINVDDVDAQYRRILAAGVEIDPPEDKPYGPRSCDVTDPWGYRWYFWQGSPIY